LAEETKPGDLNAQKPDVVLDRADVYADTGFNDDTVVIRVYNMLEGRYGSKVEFRFDVRKIPDLIYALGDRLMRGSAFWKGKYKRVQNAVREMVGK